MKTLKFKLFSLLTTLFFFTALGQDDIEKNTKFNLDFSFGIGFAKVKNDNQPNYDLNANNSQVLIAYSIKEDIGLATGLGYTQFSGNGFNAVGNFYHERDVLRIPLLLTTKHIFSDKIGAYANFGLYGQVIINDEFQFLNRIEDDVFGGWTFGFQGNLGLTYQITNQFKVGLDFATQSDFSKVETENNATFSDEQKIEQVNTFGLLFGFSF